MSARLFTIATALAATAACDSAETAGPDTETGVATLTVDASADWAWVRLGDPATAVVVAEPGVSGDWDLGFFATAVTLNGGAAGPAGVTGHCLCANAGATPAQIMAMTAESERAAFDAVTAAAIPVDEEEWKSDALAPAIEGWWSYDPALHVVRADPSKVWKIRTTSGAYAKFHVTAIEEATREHAGRVTFEYAVQPGPGAPFSEVRSATVDVSEGRVPYDLASGSPGASATWDIAFEGYEIRVNGGVSGDGGVGAVLADVSFEAMQDAGDAPAQIYRGDAFGGVFADHAWYRYNLAGQHQIWPTFDVYLIRRGDTVWKLQLIGYYDEQGNSRRISFRYARLAG